MREREKRGGRSRRGGIGVEAVQRGGGGSPVEVGWCARRRCQRGKNQRFFLGRISGGLMGKKEGRKNGRGDNVWG
jgi:hypothetical protein